MQTNHAPAPVDGRRAAATWVAGTGAFLLLAAAALFVAVNWDRIPPGGKLGIVVGLTLTCIGTGLHLRRTLPATAEALLHLGAFLVPVDVAAIGIHQQLDDLHLLLVEGVVCSAVYLLLDWLHPSVLLRWAAEASVLLLAVAIDQTTSLDAGIVLATAVVVAHLVGRDLSALRWGTATAALCAVGLSVGWAALPVAVVLGRQAERDRDLRVRFTAVAVGVVGLVSSWAQADFPADVDIVVTAGAFLAVELVAMAVGADPFWGLPARWVAGFAEVVTGLTTVPAVLLLAVVGIVADIPRSPALMMASVLVAFGWMAAELRRPTQRGLFAAKAAPAIAAAGLFVGTPAWAMLGGLAAAAWLTGTARRRRGTSFTPVFTLLATGLLFYATAVGRSELHDGGAIVVALLALWLMANVVDDVAAVLPRIAFVLPLWDAASSLHYEGAIATGLLVALVFAVDAVRRDDPRLAVGSAVAMQLVVGELAAQAGLRMDGVGLALVVGAVVWTGLAAVVEDRWRLPFEAAAVLGVTVGLSLATTDVRTLHATLVVTGALVVAVAVARRDEVVGHLGGIVMHVGFVGQLATADVHLPELYVLSPSLHLLVAGALARRDSSAKADVSSWLAYAPAPALLGLAALGARFDGGSAWHMVVAGAVGVAAMSLGGWYRLAGPLFTGTALLVTIAVHESLGTLATAPTWAWLAAGGTALLSVGVLLERSDTSPVEAGRRIVDVLNEKLS